MKYEHTEEYLLVCLMEECGELIQACSKVLRHGFDNHHPDRPEDTNWVDVLSEASDVKTIMKMLSMDYKFPNEEKEKRIIDFMRQKNIPNFEAVYRGNPQ